MKIELEEIDLRYIEDINKDLEIEEDIPLFINRIDNEYYINFTCKDKAKANLFVMELMSPSMTDELLSKFGILVNSINYCHGDNKISTLKTYLEDFIKRLDKI